MIQDSVNQTLAAVSGAAIAGKHFGQQRFDAKFNAAKTVHEAAGELADKTIQKDILDNKDVKVLEKASNDREAAMNKMQKMSKNPIFGSASYQAQAYAAQSKQILAMEKAKKSWEDHAQLNVLQARNFKEQKDAVKHQPTPMEKLFSAINNQPILTERQIKVEKENK